MRGQLTTLRLFLPTGLLFLLLLWRGVPHTGLVPTRAASGVPVQVRTGWNLVGGPTGTVFGAGGPLYTLGSGDDAYRSSAGDAPIDGGHGYWAFFATDTAITLNGAGVGSATFEAPAGRWLMIGNPSGTQSVLVSGADQVLIWDVAAGNYQSVTQLDVGQGAWAISLADATITLTATGAALPVPSPAASATPAGTPAAQPTAAAGFQLVTSPRGYQFQVPSDWQRRDLPAYDVRYAAPDQHESAYTVVSARGMAGTAASTCASFASQLQASIGNGFVSPVALSLPVTVANADDAALCLFVYTHPSGAIYTDYITVATRGSTLYVLVLDYPEDYLEQHRPTHTQIRTSFQLTVPAATP